MGRTSMGIPDDLRVEIDNKGSNVGDENVRESLQRLEFQRKHRLSVLPTMDDEVQKTLKLLDEPVQVTGEDAAARRSRLAALLASNPEIFQRFMKSRNGETSISEDDGDDEEEFYTPGSYDLVEARRFMIKFSIARARKRLENQRLMYKTLPQTIILHRRQIYEKLQHFRLNASQVASSRPVSVVRVAPTGNLVACASWGGEIKLLDSETLQITTESPNSHTDKIGGLDWSVDGRRLVTGAADRLVKVWDVDGENLKERAILRGHESRVARVRFHPSDRFVGSASFDKTWRLWDVERATELQLQEGHMKEVYCIAFQTDGSLACSAGMDALGLVWDIRCGNSIMSLDGHSRPIYGLDWSPNGYQLATGSADGTIKIWDFRVKTCLESILAHKNIVSEVKFDPSAEFLISSSYDRKVNVFSADNWHKVASLEGHTDKIMCVDLAPDSKTIVSSGWDRSVKTWKL
ncbi:LAMI_0E04984g1_1 [Lachancea mirantina]|uniref:LAMI_0E04984g1_1 n=1 Tax=Lachancea mirantina TaxID=1230905 RepID=A0A1G4JLG4_9SACH|nr:LAMI_0E04984g1_1 [Lachancea mirantina]